MGSIVRPSHFFFLAVRLRKCSATNPILLKSGKGGYPIVRPRISISSLRLKEMLGDESPLSLKRRKRWGPIVRPHISFSSLFAREMLGDESYFIMAEKVAIQSSGLAFLIPRYSLGKCLAFESHLRDSKIDLQKEVYFANWRKRWDSNPRAVARKRFSRAPRYDHFGTFPFLFLFSFSQFSKEFLYDFEAFFFHDACCNGDVGVGDG